MGLSREQILALDDLITRDVPVSEWGEGETVRVRCLSTSARLAWATACRSARLGEPGPDPTALVVALSAVNGDGSLMFQVQDVDNLAEKRGDIVERIATATLELSGLADAAPVEAEGNSEATPSGGSPSD